MIYNKPMAKTYTQLKKLKEKNGEIEFEAEITLEAMAAYENEVLAHKAESFTMPGFRKGKAPLHVVREQFDPMDLFESAADHALRDATREIVMEEHLNIIGKPELVITKLAPKNPLVFKVHFALAPEVSLPDYKKIARDVMSRPVSTEVTEQEVDEAIDRARRMMAGQTAQDANGKTAEEMEKAAPTEALPPLTNETVQQFGPFSTVAEFRIQAKKRLTAEKENEAKHAKRDELIKEIVKRTKLELPPMLVEQEWETFSADRDENLKNAGVTYEDYLKQIKKTAEDFEKEQKALLEEQIRTSMVFGQLRKAEDLVPDRKSVELMIAQLKLRYPEENEASLRKAAESIVIQETLFERLEGSTNEEKEKENKKEPQ